MRPTISDIVLTLAVVAGFFSLYIWDIPHIAALLLIAAAYRITWQDAKLEQGMVILALQGTTIQMQRDLIVDLRTQLEDKR